MQNALRLVLTDQFGNVRTRVDQLSTMLEYQDRDYHQVRPRLTAATSSAYSCNVHGSQLQPRWIIPAAAVRADTCSAHQYDVNVSMMTAEALALLSPDNQLVTPRVMYAGDTAGESSGRVVALHQWAFQ